MQINILTLRSTLTIRDAKLIFDSYTSTDLDPALPSIVSNLKKKQEQKIAMKISNRT